MSSKSFDLLQETPSFHPLYRQKFIRLKSFENWPEKQFTQKAIDLCEAGFFYTNISDCVQCYQCGISIKDWKKDDRPLEQHIHYNPNCAFLKLHTGAKNVIPINDNIKKKEKTQIAKQKLCVICKDREYDTVYVPCGDVVTCYSCAASVPTCPYCFGYYKSFTRINWL